MFTAYSARRTATILASLLLPVVFNVTSAEAGVIVGLLVNPTSTAGVATSNRSGSGSWQLYAIEDAASTDLGIGSYNIWMSGATAINHRSPNGTATNSNGDTTPWGFTFSRSGTNANPILAASALPNEDIVPPVITGFGRTANNAVAAITAVDPGATSIVATSGASWGNYLQPALWPLEGTTGHNWVFLAEGLGAAPAVTSASFTVFKNAQGEQTAAAFVGTQTFRDDFPLLAIDNVNANDPGFVSRDLSSVYTGPPPDGFWFLGYTSPAGVSSNPNLAHPPTIDPITKQFRWDTTGAMLGVYSWHSSYGQGWNPHLDITVRITAIPEPATFALVGVAMVGGFGFIGRCRSTSRPGIKTGDC